MRYSFRFLHNKTLVREVVLGVMLAGFATLPQIASAQEAALSSEPAPEEPALQLKLDSAGVEAVPSALRTADGYTLEEMELRVRRAKIGLGTSGAVVFAGGMFLGFGIGESLSNFCIFGECAPVPKRYETYMWVGTALLVGGFAGMIASGVLLGKRKRDRDSLRQAHYGKPRRVQWDLETSRVVF